MSDRGLVHEDVDIDRGDEDIKATKTWFMKFQFTMA